MAARFPLSLLVPILAVLLLGAPSSLPSAAPGLFGGQPSLVRAAALEAGANSITEHQARQRLASLRLHSVRALRMDRHGLWRGLAWHAGREVSVAMDARGQVAIGGGDVALRNDLLHTRDAKGKAASISREGGADLSGTLNGGLNRSGIHEN